MKLLFIGDIMGEPGRRVISHEMAKKIEQELTYPGQIKVTVIRESRFVDIAK